MLSLPSQKFQSEGRSQNYQPVKLYGEDQSALNLWSVRFKVRAQLHILPAHMHMLTHQARQGVDH